VRIQLKENEENCEKLNAEIDSLRKELEKTSDHLNIIMKFEKSTEILDNIISHKILPFIKTCLVYDNNQKTLEEYGSSKSSENKIEEKPESYANVLEISSHNGENHKELNHDKQETNFSFKKYKNEFRRGSPSRIPLTTRYQNIFLGYCFSCKICGHKGIDCRAYG